MTTVSKRATLLLTLLALVAPVAAQSDPDPMEARAFEIHYRDLAETVDVVSALLSPEGRTTLRPHSRTLIVEDRLSVLVRVERLLDDYDVPPRGFEVTLILFMGSDTDETRAAGERRLSQEIRGVLEKLPKFTQWQTYELLGSRSVTGVEGSSVAVDLADRYRVEFVVDAVTESRGSTWLKFGRLSLQRLVREPDAPLRVENLYSASMVVKVGSQKILGAASDPNSKQAIFLTLQARAEAAGR